MAGQIGQLDHEAGELGARPARLRCPDRQPANNAFTMASALPESRSDQRRMRSSASP